MEDFDNRWGKLSEEEVAALEVAASDTCINELTAY